MNENLRIRALAGEDTATSSSDAFAGILAAMAAHDVETCSHSRAVGAWSRRIARSMKLPSRDRERAAVAGVLHDVGKLAIPAEILLKPAALTEPEWTTIKTHASIGAEMLQRIPLLREYAPFVRAHHERVDGKGYPDGLSGTSIPLLARIVAVGDSFHAMISKRPYRQPLSIPAAIAELRRGSGKQWDPLVIEAILGVIERTEARSATLELVREA